MEFEQFNVWAYLVQVAPVVVVMGVGIKYLFKLYTDKDDDYKELQAEFRKSEMENLEVLRDLSTVLNTLLSESQDGNENILGAITKLEERLDEYIKARMKHIGNN